MDKFVSAHFKRKEFACKCGCGFAAADAELLNTLEMIREKLGSPVIITSGCRCEAHNKAVGGAAKSQHVRGMACDINVKGYTPKEVQDFLVKEIDEGRMPAISIGYGKTFTHIDVRSNPVRFSY